MPRLLRHTHIAENIVFTDGISGTGKSMMASIVSSYSRVELVKYEHIYGYLSVLDSMKKIDRDAAIFLMRMYADISLFNSMISRDTNFRLSDLSGVFENPNAFRYLRRLFYKDGNAVLERIRRLNPTLHIMTHHILCVADLAFYAFDNRLRVIEIVRHPLYLLGHWHSYINRYGNDPREFNIWLDYQGQALPWFSRGWEELYLGSCAMDKVIYAIQWLTQKIDGSMTMFSEIQKKQILFIPFEHFVVNPQPFLKTIGEFLGSDMTSETHRMLRKQKCPRKLAAKGVLREAYKRYGWKEPDKAATENGMLEQKLAFAERTATKEALTVLDTLCKDYEKRYGMWF